MKSPKDTISGSKPSIPKRQTEIDATTLDLLLDLTPTPLILVEPGTAKVLFANKAADELAGGEFPKGKSSEQYDTIYWCYDANGKRIPADKMPGVRAARGEKLKDYEMDWDTPGGMRSLLLNSETIEQKDAKPELIIITFQDVTQLKKIKTAQSLSEEKIQASEARHRTMIEQSPFSIQILSPDGLTLQVNKAWEILWGLKIEQLQAYNILEDTQLADQGLLPYIKQGFDGQATAIPPIKYEPSKNVHGDSEIPYRWVRGFIYPIKNKNGSVREVVLMHEDITLQKDAEEQASFLQQQRLELLEVNRAKDEFISLASHQLRTPATGVKQYLGIVLDGNFTSSELSQEHQALLEVAYESNERQLQIIDDLLRVAGIDAGKVILNKTTTDFVPLIEDILHEQAEKFEQSQKKVLFKSKSKSATALVDKAKIRMVIENIVDNANKYSLPHTTIEVAVTRRSKWIEISVSDQGVGIHPQDTDKLFQKFSRIDNPLSVEVGGNGLGLYWAKRIVDLHAGTIHATSVPEEGSTFTVRLPLTES